MGIGSIARRAILVMATGMAIAVGSANVAHAATATSGGQTANAVAPALAGPVAGSAQGQATRSAAVRLFASGCWYSSSHWWCNNISGAPVYASGTSNVIGYMYSNPSWFICRSDSGGYVGGPHPYRWEWTEADNGAWGWMKDTAIYSETNPLPVC
ncbi:hypothetical protein ODJ79_44660 [Actinoplanes sp. KI2]|uniref:hypothetical protein n=1 Tax=Actinoplanes sp. KI2 TaxID=2983315 RepID=UPI0021D5C3FA|nr:hypothetical protein [Actinoplanes sp. KI2]MCU7730851.1 hypothetical protein [Actinoplanes sp. KI2]